MTAFTVEAALDRYVADREQPREPDGSWHPSSISGCPRAAVYEIRGVPPTEVRSKSSRRTLAVGHTLHEYVQAAVDADPRVTRAHHEVKLRHEELNVKGSSDTLNLMSDTDENGMPYSVWELLEYKTISVWGFKKALPKDEHVTQVRVYLMALRDYPWSFWCPTHQTRHTEEPLGDALLRGRIVYVEKGDISISEHTVFLTPASERSIRQRLETLEAHRRDGTSLPPRLPLVRPKPTKAKPRPKPARDWQCSYCQWASRCWEQDGDTEQVE